MLYFVEAIYTITDPPMKFVGRFVPPLRLGAISLDMSFIVLFFGTQLLWGYYAVCNYALTSTTSTPISVSLIANPASRVIDSAKTSSAI